MPYVTMGRVNRGGRAFNPQPEPPGKQSRYARARRRGAAGFGRLQQAAAGYGACGLGGDLLNVGCPPGQYGVYPFCTTSGPPGGGAAGAECPAGSFGWQPYCYTPPSTTPSQPAPSGQTTNAMCPSDKPYGFPPYCYAMPTSIPGLPTMPGTPPGGVPTNPIPTTPPVPQAPPAPGTPPPVTGPTGQETGITGWWNARSQNEKYGVYAVGAVLALLVLRKLVSKKKRTAFATNPSRKHRRRKSAKRGHHGPHCVMYRTNRRRHPKA